MKSFAECLYQRLEAAQFVEFRDNYDESRFGPQPRSGVALALKRHVRGACRRLGCFHRSWLRRPNSEALSTWMAMIPDLEWLYGRLADDASRVLLIDIIAYRIMGPLGVRLPLGIKAYRDRREALERLADKTDSIDIHFKGWFLWRYDLASLGYPVSLYIRNPITLFEVEQYAHHESGIVVNKGDVVIDGGGCYGDTAVYFASKSGETGAVHVFEFVPSNLDVMRKNLNLNPVLSRRVSIAEKALWDQSGIKVHVRDSGPSSRVSMEPQTGYDIHAETTTIDDYVKKANLLKVDFIKLDIEGAEEKALLGAVQTIRKYHPKMSVCLYHSAADFVRLPRLLDACCPSYKFYIKHTMMHEEETVLFAVDAE